jgi:cobalt-zinc-cadmium efflux system outer membrane protein
VVQNNPALLSAQRLRNTASAAISSAGAFPNPRLEYSAGNQSARQVGGVGGSLSTYGISQLIENPALRSARVDAARSGERVSGFQVGMARNELVAQVRLRAYDLLLRQAEAAAAAEASSLLEQVNTRVRARVDTGEAPRYELIKADAETINARSLQQTALLQAQQAAITLNRLAAGTLPPQWSLDAALADTPVAGPDMATLRQLMLARNPEPDIKQNMIGVSVQIPLFDRRTGPIAEAGSELERARGRLDGRQAEMEQQLQSAEKALEMAQLRTQALSQGAVRDAEAALRVADAAWRFGERGILDVLDAQRVLRSVRADLLTARFQVQAARTELDFLSGRWADEMPALPSAALQRGGLQ